MGLRIARQILQCGNLDKGSLGEVSVRDKRLIGLGLRENGSKNFLECLAAKGVQKWLVAEG